MKLIQTNIWSGRLLAPLIDLLKQEEPDIACFQEVVSIQADIHSLLGSIQELNEEYPYKNVFYSPVFQFRLMNKEAEWGNSILSNFEISDKNTIFTNHEYIKDFNFEEYDYNIRNLQHAVLDAGGKKLNVLNHHGHHIPHHKNGDKQTMRQMKVIADYIKGLAGPVILTGDFNLSPHSESLEQINGMLRNLSVEYKLKTTRTPLTTKTEVCDYIFVSGDVRVNGFRAAEEIVSDHQALLLDFDL